MAKVLVVDDEGLMRTMVQVVCNRMGHETLLAASIQEALRMVSEPVDVVLLDVWLPDGNGLEYQADFAHLPGAPDVVVITGNGDGDNAEAALRSGAWEFLTKPLQMRDIEQCLRQILQFRQNRTPVSEALVVDSGHILGSGPGMSRALKLLAQAAKSEVNVLLLGETGVGKELFARALFRNSARAARPFITLTAPRCQKLWWKAICSATAAARSPVRTGRAKGYCLRQTKGRCFWMKWVTCLSPCSGSFCEPWNSGVFALWARYARSAVISGWWPPPIKIWSTWPRKTASGQTCSTGCKASLL